MQLLKLNSGTGAASGVTIVIGPALDSAGAEYTGLVIGDLTLSKNGTEAAMASAATLTHVSNGYYSLVTIGNNADTLGRLKIRCNKSTYQFPPLEYMVLPAMIYDSVVAGSDRLDTNVTHVADTSQTARDIGASVLLSSGTGAGQISLSGGVAQADVAKWSGTGVAVVDATGYPVVTVKNGTAAGELSTSGGKVLLQATQSGVTIPTVTTVGTLTTYTGNTPQTGDNYAITNSGTFGNSALLNQLRLRMPRKTWYVAASGGNDSNAGTLEAPLATREQALTNARNGDTIHFLAGTYSWTTTWDTSSKSNITIRGDGVATLINFNSSTSFEPAINLGDYSRLTRVKCVCTGTHGSPISCSSGAFQPQVDHCWIEGFEDAILFAAESPIVRFNYCKGQWDVITCQLSTNAIIENNYCYGTSLLGSGSLIQVNKSTGIIRNNVIVGWHNAANNFGICGVFTGAHSQTAYDPDDEGRIQGLRIEGNLIYVRNDSGSGRAICIGDSFTTPGAGNSYADVIGGSVEAINSVDAAKAFHIRMAFTSGLARAVGVIGIDAAKCVNTNITDADASTAATQATAGAASASSADGKATTILTRADVPTSTRATPDDVSGGGGETPAQVDNTEIVPSRVSKLGRRADGVTAAYPIRKMKVGDKYPVWIDTSQYGGRWLDNVTEPTSSDDDGLAIVVSEQTGNTRNLNREMVVLWLHALAVGTYTVSAVAHPRSSDALVVEQTVEVEAA